MGMSRGPKDQAQEYKGSPHGLLRVARPCHVSTLLYTRHVRREAIVTAAIQGCCTEPISVRVGGATAENAKFMDE